MHILIIEDNPADAFLTRMALRQQRRPFEITVVDDGGPGMALLNHDSPYENAPAVDLVVLDLNLPRIDGITVLRWIRGNPKLKSMPVFVLSSSPADAVGAAAEAATRYLEKPATLDEYMKIGEILSGYLDEHSAVTLV
jgi:two-component system, chemotaxis family, response regulator Rcp1